MWARQEEQGVCREGGEHPGTGSALVGEGAVGIWAMVREKEQPCFARARDWGRVMLWLQTEPRGPGGGVQRGPQGQATPSS